MKTLVLDLDHTLVFADILAREDYSGVIKNPEGNDYYVWLRPHLKEFLEFCFSNFEVHLCTAATKWYTESVLNILNIDQQKFSSVMTRESLAEKEVFDGHSSFLDYIKKWDNAIVVDDKDYIYEGQNLVIFKVVPYFPNLKDKELARVIKELEKVRAK
jgi:TFIIF-interacting CTD phosphatase-like protein